jgi:hypothetical protein
MNYLLAFLVIAAGLIVTEIKHLRRRYRKQTGRRVFVKLLPVHGLVLKIAFKAEDEEAWRARKITVASVCGSDFKGLEIIKDQLTRHWYDDSYHGQITVFNLGYRSRWTKFRDYIYGLKYPAVNENVFQLLDALEAGPKGSTVSVNNNISNVELVKRLEELSRQLELGGSKNG